MKKDDLRLSSLEELILTSLNKRELYGLDILRAVADATDGGVSLRIGSLYPTLHRMEKRGLVKSRWGDERPQEREGARRRYYSLTGLGQAALSEARSVRDRLIRWKPVVRGAS